MILGKSWLCIFIVHVSERPLGVPGDRALSHDDFRGKMVLKGPFIGDAGEALALHVHCSDLLGDSFESI